MSNELLEVFAFGFLIILALMAMFIPMAVLFNWRYSKSLNQILRKLPEDAKKILKEDIKSEAEKSFIYRILGENFFKEDDFLIRIFTDDTFKVHLKESDLIKCTALKKKYKTVMKSLVFLLLFSVIGAGVVFILFS